MPDRGGYKCGFYMAWRDRTERIKELEESLGMIKLGLIEIDKPWHDDIFGTIDKALNKEEQG